ncbi:MAG: hypothetical protein ACUZ77_06995 [Candidatus Brocadiales bacterium]
MFSRNHVISRCLRAEKRIKANMDTMVVGHHFFGALLGIWLGYLLFEKNFYFLYALAVLTFGSATVISLSNAFLIANHHTDLWPKMKAYQQPLLYSLGGVALLFIIELKIFGRVEDEAPRKISNSLGKLFFFPCLILAWIVTWEINEALVLSTKELLK